MASRNATEQKLLELPLRVDDIATFHSSIQAQDQDKGDSSTCAPAFTSQFDASLVDGSLVNGTPSRKGMAHDTRLGFMSQQGSTERANAIAAARAKLTREPGSSLNNSDRYKVQNPLANFANAGKGGSGTSSSGTTAKTGSDDFDLLRRMAPHMASKDNVFRRNALQFSRKQGNSKLEHVMMLKVHEESERRAMDEIKKEAARKRQAELYKSMEQG